VLPGPGWRDGIPPEDLVSRGGGLLTRRHRAGERHRRVTAAGIASSQAADREDSPVPRAASTSRTSSRRIQTPTCTGAMST